jgi:hypothetical protein
MALAWTSVLILSLCRETIDVIESKIKVITPNKITNSAFDGTTNPNALANIVNTSGNILNTSIANAENNQSNEYFKLSAFFRNSRTIVKINNNTPNTVSICNIVLTLFLAL